MAVVKDRVAHAGLKARIKFLRGKADALKAENSTLRSQCKRLEKELDYLRDVLRQSLEQ